MSPGQEALMGALPEKKKVKKAPAKRKVTPRRISPERAARLTLKKNQMLIRKFVRSTKFKNWKGKLARQIQSLPVERKLKVLDEERERFALAEKEAFERLNQRAMAGAGLTKGWRRDAHDYLEAQAKGIVLRKALREGKMLSQKQIEAYVERIFAS